jgi:serralysin
MSNYSQDHRYTLTPSEMDWAWRLELRPVHDPQLGQHYGRTAHFGTHDPYAGQDDIFVFHATRGMAYTVQSGSYFDPVVLRVFDDLGKEIASDDGSGAYGYDYASFVAPYTGWYYIDAAWSQDYYDTYASVNVYEDRAPVYPITNTIVGGAGHDMLYGTRSDDIVDGGAGIDTFVLEGYREEYTVSGKDGAITVTDLLGLDGIDTLRNVERLSFEGGDHISYETTGFPAEAYRLYQAAFDRTPDKAGLGYWIGRMGDGTSLHAVADAFVHSAEFGKLAGAAATNADIVTLLYANVLDRAPDAEGFAYWKQALDSKTITVADMLVGFSESPENQVKVIGSLQAGYEFIVS